MLGARVRKWFVQEESHMKFRWPSEVAESQTSSFVALYIHVRDMTGLHNVYCAIYNNNKAQTELLTIRMIQVTGMEQC